MNAFRTSLRVMIPTSFFRSTTGIPPVRSRRIRLAASSIVSCGFNFITLADITVSTVIFSGITSSRLKLTLAVVPLTRTRPVQYLNNILEQDHRAIKRRVKAKQSFREFQAARRTIEGYEAMHMIRKGQARWVSDDDIRKQNQFIDKLFDLSA